MQTNSYRFFDGKVIIHTRDRLCDTPEELLSSELFRKFLERSLDDLRRRDSKLLGIFAGGTPAADDVERLIRLLGYLAILPIEQAIRLVDGAEAFARDRELLNDSVEYLYNAWRSLERFIVCDSAGDRYDRRPYRTFNNTVETLTHLVRSVYRDVQENITGRHPRIYRQVRAGADVSAIALPVAMDLPGGAYAQLNQVPLIRQALIYPPLIFSPPMNKRTGSFEPIDRNPLETVDITQAGWLGYPARVGALRINAYFAPRFYELGFTLCNLFELADDADLGRRPDAVVLFGVPPESLPAGSPSPTVFYDDAAAGVLVGAIPAGDEFGYFGYLKKMMLTLHNVRSMQMGRMPFHGALVRIAVRGRAPAAILILGDTGAGKSETLEALRLLGDQVQDITIIADDMGSLQIDAAGHVLGYGTETGAFVRLDDLQPGFAFGQIDRTIIMSPNQTNARVILPVTTYANVIQGVPIDYMLYANNYEAVDAAHPTLERFATAATALEVFRAGRVMSKGTTTTTGMVSTYFANVFGPAQYPDLHEGLAARHFDAFFEAGTYVGQLRTQLGVAGSERSGPAQAAAALLALLGG